MQCHLETTSLQLPGAMTRFGRDVFSYRPGEPLSDYAVSFDHAPGTGHDEKFELVSSAYRLRKSRCFTETGQLTCTNCHDPHRKVSREEAAERTRGVCVGCHAAKVAGLIADNRHTAARDCASCHMPRRQGGRVGPDLSGINNKTKEELLTSILNPSFAIEPRFVNYVVTTTDGRMFDGVIANETPGAITLRGGSEEGDQTILRKNIAEIRASSVSLMPEDLEQSLNKQDLADVIAYLRGGL